MQSWIEISASSTHSAMFRNQVGWSKALRSNLLVRGPPIWWPLICTCIAVWYRCHHMEPSGTPSPSGVCHGSCEGRQRSHWTKGELSQIEPAPKEWTVQLPLYDLNRVVLVQSKTHVVLLALNRPESPLSTASKKIFRVDDHMGIAISGLIPDGRTLCKYMENECLSHKYVFCSWSLLRHLRPAIDCLSWLNKLKSDVATDRQTDLF